MSEQPQENIDSSTGAYRVAMTPSHEWGNIDHIKIFLCPICGFDYTHIGKPEWSCGCDSYHAWNGRGSATRIPFAGECGHSWTLVIGFHKGQSFALIENAYYDVGPNGELGPLPR